METINEHRDASLCCKLGEAVGVSYGMGVLGNTASDLAAKTIDLQDIDTREMIAESFEKGVANVYSAMGCGMTDCVIITGASPVYRALGVGISVTAQAISDGLAFIIGKASSMRECK